MRKPVSQNCREDSAPFWDVNPSELAMRQLGIRIGNVNCFTSIHSIMESANVRCTTLYLYTDHNALKFQFQLQQRPSILQKTTYVEKSGSLGQVVVSATCAGTVAPLFELRNVIIRSKAKLVGIFGCFANRIHTMREFNICTIEHVDFDYKLTST